jgi:hypothetical protein
MGWLAGILSGYADRQHEIRRENAELDADAAKREAAIYQTLLNHDDPEIRGMAATGIFQMGQGRKSQGGFAGWMGKMQSSPIYPTLMKYMETPQRKEAITPGLSSSQTSGYLPSVEPGGQSWQGLDQFLSRPAPTSAAGPAATATQLAPETTETAPNLAQPATSPTEGGQMATPQPMPGAETAVATPPPTPPKPTQAQLAAPPAATSWRPGDPLVQDQANPTPVAAAATPPPPPPAVDASAASPGPAAAVAESPLPGGPPAPPSFTDSTTVVGRAPAANLTTRQVAGPAVGRSEVTYERPYFPTEEERATKLALAKERSDYLAAVEMFQRAGDPDPEKSAADYIVASKQRGAGVNAYKPVEVEFLGPDGQVRRAPASFNASTGRYHDQNGNPLPPDAQVVAKTSGRAYNKREEIAAAKFGKEGEDPIAVSRRLTPKERAIVLREEGILAAEAALARAEAAANAPLTALAKSNLTEKLAGEWREVQKPQMALKTQLDRMKSALDSYERDPNGASQVILMTFNKLLDPDSVVREGEYDRSIHGIGVLNRIKGWWEKYGGRIDTQTGRLIAGGTGIPLSDLREMALTAQAFSEGMADHNENERARLELRASQHMIDPRGIFGGPPPPAVAEVPQPGGGGVTTGGAGGAGAGVTTGGPPGKARFEKDEKGNWTVVR